MNNIPHSCEYCIHCNCNNWYYCDAKEEERNVSEEAIKRKNKKIKIDAAKAEAEAETTKAEAARKTAEANAEVALIKANSYANTEAIEAKADIDRIKSIGNVLTQEYLEYTKYEKWNGALPTHTNGETYISLENEN